MNESQQAWTNLENITKDQEIEQLKKEIQDLKEKLATKDAELKAVCSVVDTFIDKLVDRRF